MRQVSGAYPDKKGGFIDFDVQIASEWTELTPQQVATILEVLNYTRADKYVITASLLSLIFDKHWHILANLDNEYLESLSSLTNFLFETQPPAINFFPKLKINKKACFAPADDLNNIGFGEWCFAYQAYHYYMLSKDKIYLDKLIAVLYRPADPAMQPDSVNYTGDIRQVFNENLILRFEKSVADIEIRFKQAVLAWFGSSLANIMAARPHVFPKKDENEVLPDEAEPAADHRTWFTVFRELLGPKWGTEDKLKFTNAIFVLDALEEQEIELKRK